MSLLNQLQTFFAVPAFADDEQARLAGLVNVLSLAVLAICLIAAVSSAMFGYFLSGGVLVVGAFGPLGALWLIRRRHLRTASLALLLEVLVLLNILVYVGDGVHDVVVLAYPALILIAALFLPRRLFGAYAALSIMSLQGNIYGELNGSIVNKFSPFTTFADFVHIFIIMIITAITAHVLSERITSSIVRLRIAHRTLAENNRTLQSEVIERKRAEESLQQARERLEDRVAERTAELAASNARLQCEFDERLRAQDALRKSERRFRELADLLPQTVFETDLQARFTYVNRQGFALTGYTPDDFKAGLNVFHIMIPEDHARATRNITARLHEGGNEPHEYTLMRKDGSTFPALVYSAPIIRDRQAVGLRGIAIDMTRLKHLEAQLVQSQKMEAVGQLAGGIAHDFNTLLGIILGYGDMMRDDLVDESVLRENLEEIIKAGQRAKILVRQLLDFARPNLGDRHPVRLAPLVEDTFRLLRASLRSTIFIRRRSESASRLVPANSSQIEQVIMNLGMNAGDAIGEQGGEIDISLTDVEINEDWADTQAVQPGPYVQLCISDTGGGMRPDTLDHIFEPFFTTKEVGKGSGLGLAVVHGIVTSHEGFITVESTPGKGTMFHVYLPAIDT